MHILAKMSIKNKLMAMAMFTAGISLIIGFIILLVYNNKNLQKDMIDNSIMNARLLAESCLTPLEFQYSLAAEEALEKLKVLPEVKIAIVYDAGDQVFADYFYAKKHIDHPFKPVMKNNSFIYEKNLHIFQPIMSQGKQIGTVYLKISAEKIFSRTKKSTHMMFLILLFIILISYLISWKLQSGISDPLLKLANISKEISEKDDYNISLDHNRSDEIGLLYDSFEHMIEIIKIRIKERDTANEYFIDRTIDLSKALEELQSAQAQLIQSEKMASLGQLIAGVAHEVNTPLGAINSSVGNILNNLYNALHNLPENMQELEAEELMVFRDLLNQSLENRSMLSAKEERKFKRQISAYFDDQGVENSHDIADSLIDMGIYDHYEHLVPFFKKENGLKVLNYAYKLSGIYRSALNIKTASEKASKVVFALKSYSRFDHSGEKIKADVCEGIDTVLTIYHNQIKHGINLIKHFDTVPLISCYPDELNQVWTNIVHNAIQAMDNKGNLEISIHQVDNKIKVNITDSGKGIPTEIKDKIFEPFFTTKPKGEGSGLGLDIVKKIIDKHNGEIQVDSEPGKTTFSVLLPVDQE